MQMRLQSMHKHIHRMLYHEFLFFQPYAGKHLKIASQWLHVPKGGTILDQEINIYMADANLDSKNMLTGQGICCRMTQVALSAYSSC